MTPLRTIRVLVLSLLLVAALGCGNDDPSNDALAVPERGDADFGTFGHLLGSDGAFSTDGQVDRLWVGFGREEEWSRYLRLRQTLADLGTVPYVGGQVVVDRDQPLGFYFDPATTSATEVIAETFQTSIDELKSNPTAFAGKSRFVAFITERVVPGSGE